MGGRARDGGGQERGDVLVADRRDGATWAAVGQPRCERGHVAPVLADRVRGSAVGFELDEEPIESGLELHLGVLPGKDGGGPGRPEPPRRRP